MPDKYKRIQLSLKGPTCGSRDSPLRSFLQCRARFYLCSENKGGKKMRWLVSCDKQGCEPAAERDPGETRSAVDSNDLQRFPP